MKPFALLLLYPVLGSIGYLVTTSLISLGPDKTPESVTEPGETLTFSSGSEANRGPIRDPRSGATFAESLGRLPALVRSFSSYQGADYYRGVDTHMALLEIDRIFALATETEMIAWFAGADHSETETAILSSAFARLAEFSPTMATGIWQDLHPDATGVAGVDGLVRSWARLDPAGAEVWLDALTDPKARNAALIAFLDTILVSDPDRVERRVTEISDIWGSIGLTQDLAWEMDPGRLESFADRVLAYDEGKWEYQNQLTSILTVWGEKDSAAMLAWITSQESGRLKGHVMSQVATAAAGSDPAALANAIGPSLSGNAALGQIAGQAWMKWFQEGHDNDAATAWFEAYGEDLSFPAQLSWGHGGWTTDEATQALDRLRRFSPSEFRMDFEKAILRSLSRSDPASALVLAKGRLPAGHDGDNFISSTVNQIAREGDPEKGLALALENARPGEGRDTAVRWVMTTWAERDPLAAVERSLQLPQNLQKKAFEGISYQWAQDDPEAFSTFCRNSPGEGRFASFAKNGFWQIGHDEQGSDYLETVLNFPKGDVQTEAIAGLFSGWARANLETASTALTSLEAGPLRDSAIVEFTTWAGGTDQVAALSWALDISSESKRKTATMTQARRWLKMNRESATAWIRRNDSIPPEWKSELLDQDR